MVLKCLFLISDDISIYKQKGNELTPIKFKGDIFYNGDILEMMNWFEDKSGYIEGETKFDICILKKEDIEIELDFSKYSFVEKTSWKYNDIVNFMMQKVTKSRIKYNNKYLEVVNKNKVIKGDSFVDFNLNIYPDDEKFIVDKIEKEADIEIENQSNMLKKDIEKEESILARYYRQKTLEIDNI